MAKIWAVMKDPGGTNAVWPVVEELRRRKHIVLPIAHGKAIELLAEKKVSFVAAQDTNALQNEFLYLPDVYITSMCNDGGIGRNMIPALRSMGIPTVAVQDYWGRTALTEFRDPRYWPDAVCAQDKLGKEMVLDAWTGYETVLRGRVEITGQPAFDVFAAIDVPATKMRVLKNSDCKESFQVVLYAGQLEASAETFASLVKALNCLPQPVRLIALKHPRMSSDAPEEEKLWNEALGQFTNGVVLKKGNFSTEEWVVASDLIVSMFSTLLATAAHLRKECLSILLPEAGGKRLQESKWPFLPFEKLGSCAVARSQNEVEMLLKQALSVDGLGLRKNQKKHFRADGKGASRVADVIESLLK